MKKLVLVDDKHGHWDLVGDFDDDMDFLRAFLVGDDPDFLSYSLEFLQKNKDWDSAQGNLIELNRHDGLITLTYEFDDNEPSFTIQESELEKILVSWLKLIESGAQEITIESQDDEHYTITGK